jgi:hypothetical protein
MKILFGTRGFQTRRNRINTVAPYCAYICVFTQLELIVLERKKSCSKSHHGWKRNLNDKVYVCIRSFREVLQIKETIVGTILCPLPYLISETVARISTIYFWVTVAIKQYNNWSVPCSPLFRHYWPSVWYLQNLPPHRSAAACGRKDVNCLSIVSIFITRI